MSKSNIERVMTELTGYDYGTELKARAKAFSVVDDLLHAIYVDGGGEHDTGFTAMALERLSDTAKQLANRRREAGALD